MKPLLRLLIGMLGLLLFLILVSYFFPAHYKVERSVQIEAPAGEVFAVVGDLRNWPEWTIWWDLDPEMETFYPGDSSGVGARMLWNGPKSGRGEVAITVSEAPGRLEYDRSFPDHEMSSRGVLTIARAGTGVWVTWSDQGELGMNPINRWFGLFLDSMMGGDLQDSLLRLKRMMEKEEAAPEFPAVESE